jgi:hypothetical protein
MNELEAIRRNDNAAAGEPAQRKVLDEGAQAAKMRMARGKRDETPPAGKGPKIAAALHAYVACETWDPLRSDDENIRGVMPKGYRDSVGTLQKDEPRTHFTDIPQHIKSGWALVNSAMMRIKPTIPEIRMLIFHWHKHGKIRGYLITNEMRAAAKLLRMTEDDVLQAWFTKLWQAVAEGVR